MSSTRETLLHKGYTLVKTELEEEDALITTPSTNDGYVGETTVLAQTQMRLLHEWGAEWIAYEAEGGGHCFQDIIPVKSMAQEQTSVGSQTELEIHTEQAFSPWKPDILSLACLRGDPNAYTYVLPVERVIENIEEAEYATLFEPLWKIGVDLSFRQQGVKDEWRGPISILSRDERGKIRFVFDQDLMQGITEEAENLCKKIVDIYYRERSAICLEAGDILFLDNRMVVHGRSPFSPRYDGKDRFLVRCFGVFGGAYKGKVVPVSES